MYCNNCGNEILDGSKFCKNCGTKVEEPVAEGEPVMAAAPPQYQAPQQPQYQAPQQPQYQGGYAQAAYAPRPKMPHYAPGSYIESLHSFGGSLLFMIGIILYSAGSLFNCLFNVGFGTIFQLMMLALPITGLWLIFAASKAPRLPEKTLTSLTLFKIKIIIDLVMQCLGALVFVILAIIAFAAAGGVSSYGGSDAGAAVGGIIAVGFILLLVAGVMVTFIIIYFKSVLQTLESIRRGIAYNAFEPMAGIKTFTILTYIGIGLSVIGSLSQAFAGMAMNDFMYMIMNEIPSEFEELLEIMPGMGMGSPSMGIIALFFNMIASGGIVVMLVSLTQFNNEIINKRH